MGIDLIEWTYDPLQALNAHLNFARLGVVVEEYEENIYGESSSPLHRGTPTDRFVAEWRLREPHVERRIGSRDRSFETASVTSAPVVNPSKPGGDGLAPSEGDLTLESPRARRDPDRLRRHAAPRSRSRARVAHDHPPDLSVLLGRGYRVVDFFLSREAGRGHYLLAAELGSTQSSSSGPWSSNRGSCFALGRTARRRIMADCLFCRHHRTVQMLGRSSVRRRALRLKTVGSHAPMWPARSATRRHVAHLAEQTSSLDGLVVQTWRCATRHDQHVASEPAGLMSLKQRRGGAVRVSDPSARAGGRRPIVAARLRQYSRLGPLRAIERRTTDRAPDHD